MNVSEFRSQISTWENEGKIKAQTVEFIIDSKKYFASDVKAGVNTMSFEVTRNNYKPLPLKGLKDDLALAAGEVEVIIRANNNQKSIESIYLSDDFMEIVLA